ncbi:MAG TPA: hypothetical protein V6D20_20895 [Candidatus Obscuribacterales bacterium]
MHGSVLALHHFHRFFANPLPQSQLNEHRDRLRRRARQRMTYPRPFP